MPAPIRQQEILAAAALAAYFPSCPASRESRPARRTSIRENRRDSPTPGFAKKSSIRFLRSYVLDSAGCGGRSGAEVLVTCNPLGRSCYVSTTSVDAGLVGGGVACLRNRSGDKAVPWPHEATS